MLFFFIVNNKYEKNHIACLYRMSTEGFWLWFYCSTFPKKEAPNFFKTTIRAYENKQRERNLQERLFELPLSSISYCWWFRLYMQRSIQEWYWFRLILELLMCPWRWAREISRQVYFPVNYFLDLFLGFEWARVCSLYIARLLTYHSSHRSCWTVKSALVTKGLIIRKQHILRTFSHYQYLGIPLGRFHVYQRPS